MARSATPQTSGGARTAKKPVKKAVKKAARTAATKAARRNTPPAKVPPKKVALKKGAPKKTPAGRPAAKKAAPGKTPTRKPPTRKTPARQTGARKRSAASDRPYTGPPRVRLPLREPAPARKRRARRPTQTHPHFGLPNDALVEMWYLMLLSRRVAERWFTLNRQGRAPFVITGQGQEAAQVGTAAALTPGKDWVLPYYRDIGVMLTLGMTVEELMLNVFAKATDPNSGGRQMPAHWSDKEMRVVSQSSVVGTQIPMAAGLAWAAKLQGEDAVAVSYIGEGSTSQGDFHEGLNFAAVHHLPMILVVENNGYAITEVQEKEMVLENVADRAPAYGIKGLVVDGNDLLLVYRNMHQLVQETRNGGGPAILELKTYRTVPHSSDDDDRRYRTREELESWLKRDPIDRFREHLIRDRVLTPEHAEQLSQEAEQEVLAALERAEAAPDPDPATLLDHLFAPASRSDASMSDAATSAAP